MEYNLENKQLYKYIIDSIPYPIVFVDANHIIRFLNMQAEHWYYDQRGYDNLIGKSLFDCHNDHSKDMIIKAVEKLKNHANEIYCGVTPQNYRFYLNPVRNSKGELVGYFERFEQNMKK